MSKKETVKGDYVFDADGQRSVERTRVYKVTVRLFDSYTSFEVTQACYQTRRGDVLPRYCR